MWTTTLKQLLGPTLAHERVEETISLEDVAFTGADQGGPPLDPRF